MCPHPSSPAAPGIPQPGRGPAATLTAAEGPGTSLLSSVSLSPLCNGTAGFLGGTAEDSVPRAPILSWPWTPPWLARCPQIGFQEDREPQLPRSNSSLEAMQPEATPPRSPTSGLVGPGPLGDTTGASLVLRQGSWVRRKYWWSEPWSFLGSGADLHKI